MATRGRRIAANREDASSLICDRHGEPFARFTFEKSHSYGCPVCVGLMRAQIRKLRNSFKSKLRGTFKPKNALETA